MKTTTLAIIVREVNGKTETLLGEKKKGELGTGVLSGPGGKLEPDETIEQCLFRETMEEWEIVLDLASAEKVAVITFWADGNPHNECSVFVVREFSGELRETPDMHKPEWYDINNLPFDRMFESDREWFDKALRGEKFRANAYYRNLAKNFSHIEFFPWVES